MSVYREARREFAEGDRIQFRAPFTEKRIANGELGTIAKIGDEEMVVKLDAGREIGFEMERFRHLDHGYAVTSHSSQGTTVDRVLINADTSESRVLLNDRMGYVAVSRAREDAIIYTDSIEALRGALDRRVDKEMALEATKYSEDYARQLRDDGSRGDFSHPEQPGTESSLDQGGRESDRQAADIAAHVAEVEEMEFSLSS